MANTNSSGTSGPGHDRPSEKDKELHNFAMKSECLRNRETEDLEHCHDHSAKLSRMAKEKGGSASMTYTWKQTNSDITVTIKLKGLGGEQKGAYDVSFTSREVNICVSNDIKHHIQFYGAIEKEKSRVQLTKETIILIVAKQQHILWPTLEATTDRLVSNDFKGGGEETINGNLMSAGTLGDKIICDENFQTRNNCGGSETVHKDEEPVYQLDHLKHGFFERDMFLSLQVYVKSLEKDAVKIEFYQQGFVLKFHTGDPKFLQLHEGTSSETTFTWSVTTRQEIIPEESKYNVKQNGIEITLQKLSGLRWASLEAPMRKEPCESNKTDSWMPLARNTTPSEKEISCTEANKPSEKSSSSNIVFDDMVDIDLKKDNYKSVFSGSYPTTSSKQEQSMENINSVFGSGVRTKSNISQDWNKPTAKVHPLNKQVDETSTAVVSPGYSGLVNLGNTCFMNCVLQVLVNTREFRDYFLDDRFQHEINEDNPLGMKGQLAATFGLLLKRIWSCLKYCWEPRKLKELISKKNPQFFGYAQHDAHEFLAFLLDGLHEDLNRIRKKPYIETTDSNGRPDDVVADEAWSQYKLRNDSVVVDLFQGQYKSKLVCPICGKVSITFDPFLYMSVPLPKKRKIIPVTFMWKESYKKPVQYQIVVSQDSTVEKLIEELAQRTNVKPQDIRVFEAYKGKILKFFLAGASLNNVEFKDIIIASEVLSEELAGEEVYEIPVMQRTLLPSDYPNRCAFCHKPCQEGCPIKRCTKCLKVGYCDHTCQRKHWNSHKAQCSTSLDPIGCPFIMSLPASRATYGYMVKHMEGFARFSVDVFQPPVKSQEVLNPSTPPAANQSPITSISKASSATAIPQSNLSSSLSQSCSSLNSLDSLSSASSTCTLTGDQSDPQTQADAGDDDGVPSSVSDTDNFVTAGVSPLAKTHSQTCPSLSDSLPSGDINENMRSGSVDSGFESIPSRTSEKSVPTSQVMGMQMSEQDRDKAIPTFFIKPVTIEGVGIKGAERLEDKGDTPLELTNRRILSMDWRNNERLPSYVLVQSKELEADETESLNNATGSNSNKPSLYQCLELFTEPEVLSREEAWYCPSCKKHVEASKQMSIWRLPHTLIIQLKRFSFQNFLMRSKIKKHVDFPTRGLDLTEFCVGQKPGEAPPIYDLYGVANHHGLLIGGHYTSYVRCHSENNPGSTEVAWRLCDDSRVSTIPNEKSVVTADAYLLFYRRRGCTGIIGGPQSTNTKTEFSNLNCVTNLILPPSEPHVIPSSTSSRERKSSLTLNLPSQQVTSTGLNINTNTNKLCQEQRLQGSSLNSHVDLNQTFSTRLSSELCRQSESEEVSPDTGYVDMGDVELMEKQDREKDLDVCDNDIFESSSAKSLSLNTDSYNKDLDDDNFDLDDFNGQNKLVIDSGPDLGYTDMEAVD